MGICNKIAGMLAPVLIGTLVLHGIGDLDKQVQAADAVTKVACSMSSRRQDPCAVPSHGGPAGLAVAVLFRRCRRSSPPNARRPPAQPAQQRFQFPHLWLGVLCLFVYVGVEVMADAIGTYGHGFDLPLDQTKMFTSLTLGAMLIGYVVGLLVIPKVVSQSRYLTISAVLGVVFCLAPGPPRLRIGGLRGPAGCQ